MVINMMEYQLEQEWKGLMNEDAFHRLLDYAARKGLSITEANQINHYFDTEDLKLLNRAAMVRIREKGNKYEMTCKIAHVNNQDDQPQTTDEYNVMITANEADAYINKGKKWTEQNEIYNKVKEHLGVDVELLHLGALRTKRIAIDFQNGLEPLCLDHSEYLGITDYELEWETNDIQRAKEVLSQCIEELQIDVDWNVLPKSARFFKALKNQPNA